MEKYNPKFRDTIVEDGKTYLIDTQLTFEGYWETMAFNVNKDGTVDSKNPIITMKHKNSVSAHKYHIDTVKKIKEGDIQSNAENY